MTHDGDVVIGFEQRTRVVALGGCLGITGDRGKSLGLGSVTST